MFEILWHAIIMDWALLLPILFCSVVLVGVAIERWYFYNKNKRDVVQFIHRLQRELQRGNLENAQILSSQLGGIVGEVSEEGVRILAEQPEGFDRSFDITSSLAARKLEKNLPALGTIATISPYLGLFATVARILLTFAELSRQTGGTQSNEIMFGIASALVATAFGLIVAILSVTLNNWFQSTVNRYEDDFQLLKLLFLSFVDEDAKKPLGRPVAPGRTLPEGGF